MPSHLDRFLRPGWASADTAPPATVATVATVEDLSGFTRPELLALADPADRVEFDARPEALAVFARSLREQSQIAAGQRPPRFDAVATCHWCGPVWVPAHLAGEKLLGCRWCMNRESGRPIPQPPEV